MISCHAPYGGTENHNGLINGMNLLRACAGNGGEKMLHCNAVIRKRIGYVEEILRKNGKLGVPNESF